MPGRVVAVAAIAFVAIGCGVKNPVCDCAPNQLCAHCPRLFEADGGPAMGNVDRTFCLDRPPAMPLCSLEQAQQCEGTLGSCACFDPCVLGCVKTDHEQGLEWFCINA